MKGQDIINQVRAYLDFLVGWLKWAAGLGLAVCVFVLVSERLYGFDVPYLSAPDPQTLAWIAGGYWLSR